MLTLRYSAVSLIFNKKFSCAFVPADTALLPPAGTNTFNVGGNSRPKLQHMYYAEWVMFFDEFAEDLHPTFQKELNRKLFEKGSSGTGIKHFDKHDFQLIVGMKDMQINVVGDRVYAKIDFVTPASFSFPVDIFWTANGLDDLSTIHKSDITGKQLEVNWSDNFPIDKILPHIRPCRTDKKGKNGFEFDVEY